jgi:hypothetical protein
MRQAWTTSSYCTRPCSNLARGSPPGAFDAVISQRCLINLPTWEDQKAALEQSCEVLASGGILLVSEGFFDELVALDQLRTPLVLSPISVSPYNYFLT